MTATGQSDRRRLLPRWRTWQMALLLKEAAPAVASKSPQRFAPALESAIRDWELTPTATRGAEVLAAAMAYEGERDTVLKIASTVRDGRATSSLRALATTVLQADESVSRWPVAEVNYSETIIDEGATRRYIAELRGRTRSYPRNPFTWMDLARAYFAEGLDLRAHRCIEIGLQLDPDNRFLVRSASRFLVQIGDEQRASRIVSTAAGSADDPWLLSVEFALQRPGRRASLRRGKELLENTSLAPWHLGELGAVLASREDEHGADRMARRFMRRALIDPNENVLAHAEWARHLVPSDSPMSLPRAPYEALARRHARRLEWASASAHAWQWHVDEPFSALAAGTGSSYAIHAKNFEQAERMITTALRSNPGDATLLNNRAFARACQWDLQGAFADIKQVNLKLADRNSVGCVIATAGFIAFRSGNAELGRQLYARSISMFRARKESDLAATAAINWASEECRIGSGEVDEALARAESTVRACQSPEVSEAWANLQDSVPIGGPCPPQIVPQPVDVWTLESLGEVDESQ